MRFLGVGMIFAGYTLLYAAVAAGGVLATDPWAALYIDAYTQSTALTANQPASS
jgi:hypothetical protein